MPVQRPASYSTLLALLVLGIASACGDDPGGPRTPAVVEPLTPSPISATAGTSVSLAVRVLDNRGDPMPGVAVNWTVISGGGTISGGASGPDGRAEAVWVLGVQVGEQRAQASVEGAGSTVFTVDAAPLTTPTITSIAPAVLRPGIAATITGGGFAANPAENTVTVAGVAAAVTAASPNELTITVPDADRLPCRPTGPVPVVVTVAGARGSIDHPLEVATRRSLGPGESVLIADASAVRCNELPNDGGRYVIAVFNRSTVLSSTSAFRLRGASGSAAADQAPAIADVAPPAADAMVAATLLARQPASHVLASGPQEELQRALRERGAAHERMLALNLDLLRRVGPRRPAARDAAGVAANARIAAAVAASAPPAVGDTVRFRIPNIDSANLCQNPIEVVGRVVYSGTRAVVFEDVDAPLAGRIDSLYVKLGEEYDNTIHRIITQYFGDPLKLDPATDANGRLYMLFSKVINDFNGNVFAFVFSGDLFPRSQCSQSNQAEIFYGSVPTVLSDDPFDFNVSSNAWYRYTRGVLSHEVKHIASFAERISRNGVAEEEWLEEGTARIAEELLMREILGFIWKGNTTYAVGMRCVIFVRQDPACAGTPYGMWSAFVGLGDYLEQNETSTPLGRPEGTEDFSFYGSAWALVRWAVDHTASDEAAFLRALTQQSSLRGVANLEAQTGLSFGEMVADYVLALALDDRPGFDPARSRLRMLSWNLYDMFTNLHEVQPHAFPHPYPLVPRAITFGDFDVSVPTLRAGTASIFELSGAQTGPQTIELASASGGAPPTTLGLHIVRVQ